jgi:XTP/dITP diphosphohydrolase
MSLPVELAFVTSNEHKFSEAEEILKGVARLRWRQESYREVQAETLEEVVREALTEIPGDNFFIEDAGLFITALNGFPGVYSAYVFKTIGNEGILRLLRGEKNREASFQSVVGLKLKGEVKLFTGEVRGRIALEAKGGEGFGYDPIFIPEGYDRTFAENPQLKQRVSHRKRALEKLSAYLKATHHF